MDDNIEMNDLTKIEKDKDKGMEKAPLKKEKKNKKAKKNFDYYFNKDVYRPNKIEKDFADISEKDKFIINENHLKNIDSVMINSIYIL